MLKCIYKSPCVLSDLRCQRNRILTIAVCGWPSSMANQSSFAGTTPQQRCVCRCSQIGAITQAKRLSLTRHTSPQVHCPSFACLGFLRMCNLRVTPFDGKNQSVLLLLQPAHTKDKLRWQSPQQYQKRPLLCCQATSVASESSPLLLDSQAPKRR